MYSILTSQRELSSSTYLQHFPWFPPSLDLHHRLLQLTEYRDIEPIYPLPFYDDLDSLKIHVITRQIHELNLIPIFPIRPWSKLLPCKPMLPYVLAHSWKSSRWLKIWHTASRTIGTLRNITHDHLPLWQSQFTTIISICE